MGGKVGREGRRKRASWGGSQASGQVGVGLARG